MSDCINWSGYLDGRGYGRINRAGIVERAHRYVWKQAYGDIPKDRVICHKCDNPSCVNLLHLFIGTLSDNSKDMMRKHRHPCRKLKDEDVKEIRTLSSYGYRNVWLAEVFGVNRDYLSQIVNDKITCYRGI